MEDTFNGLSTKEDDFDTETCLSETSPSDSEGSEGSLVDADQLTLLDYAQSHGLCTDYTTINPLAWDSLGCLQSGPPCDDGELCQPQMPEDFTIDERICIDRDSAIFLREALGVFGDETSDTTTTNRKIKASRAESPLLQTDAIFDFRLFALKSRLNNTSDTSKYPRFPDDEELDMKLEWLPRNVVATKDAEASSEKLQLTFNDACFLQMVSPDEFPDNEDESLFAYERKMVKPSNPKHATPPLLPMSPPYSPSVPDAAAGHLELASTPADPAEDERAELDELLLNEDVFFLRGAPEKQYGKAFDSEDYVGMISTFENAVDQSSSPSARAVKRPRADDFKEDVPLLAPSDQPSPLKKVKTVTFSEMLATTIPDYARAFSPDYYDVPGEDDDHLFDEMIQPAAKAALLEVENEQLSAADSLLRVEVPVVDNSMPALPWESFKPSPNVQDSLTHQKKLLSVLKEEILHREKPWPGNVDKDISTWLPFPVHLGQVAAVEEFDDGSLERYLAKLSFEESEITVWKPEGLRILTTREEDEDDLEEVDFEYLQGLEPGIEDMQTLLSRRQQEMVEKTQSFEDEGRKGESMIKPERLKITLADRKPNATDHTGTQAIFGGAFSATTSLGRFMQAQTGAAPSAELSSAKAENNRREENINVPMPLPEDKATKGKFVPPGRPPLPVPELSEVSSANPRYFILSSTLFKYRSLLRIVEKQYPTACLVERDFDARILVPEDGSAANLSEADLLLSPGAGLVLSTLQEIKQKPLPGQLIYKGIRDRISSLANRYEQLIVLVSEGQAVLPAKTTGAEPIQALDERDCTALNSLTSFAAQLDADVQVLYIPGGEDTLASWTVSCMLRYGIDNAEIQLVPEETLWEVTLRKAGMNAFAAQAVLATLKEPSGVPGKAQREVTTTGFGLAAFLQMRPEERIARFNTMMGGERLLRRVGRVIDERWSSGAATLRASSRY